MKNILKGQRTLVCALALSSVALGVLVACGGGVGIDIVPSTGVPSSTASADLITKGKYNIVLVDTLTGERITDELTVSFKGSAGVVDSNGKAINNTSLNTSEGLVSVGADFTATNKEFSILVGNRALGWVETGVSIIGDSTTAETRTVEVKLLNTNRSVALNADTSKAITMAVQTVTPVGSVLVAAPVTQNAPLKTVTNAEGVAESTGGAALTMPAGVKAVDPVTGAVITPVGNLTVSTTKFANSNAGSMSAFPGGFAASISNPNSTATIAATAAAGGASSGTFITGGFAQFNVTDSTGKALKQFDKPLDVSIDLPKTSKKADGTALVVGDIYPVWSFDDATGQWKFEKNGTVQEKTPVDPLNFTVAFSTNHLSSWNLDFYVASCTAKVTLTGRTDARPLNLVVTGLSGQRFTRTIRGVTDSDISLLRMPTGVSATVELFDGVISVGKTAAAGIDLCAGTTIALAGLPVKVYGSVKVDVTEACVNGASKRASPTATWLNRNGSTEWRSVAAVTAGSVASANFAQVEAGTPNYIVWARDPRTSKFVTQTAVVTANAVTTVPVNFVMPCTNVTGGTQ